MGDKEGSEVMSVWSETIDRFVRDWMSTWRVIWLLRAGNDNSGSVV